VTGSLPPPPPPRARPARWVVAVAVAVVVLVAGVAVYVATRTAAPGPGSPSGNPAAPEEISLLPSSGTRSACITDTPGLPRPTLPLANGTLQANTYDVPNGTTGHAGMCYDAADGSLFSYANWSRVGPAGGWFSYPQVAYGVNDYLGAFTTYTNQSPDWVLPQTVAATVNESLWVTAAYDLRAPNASDVDGYDLSFDDFLSQGLPPRLEMGPFVEVEIFLAHHITYPFEWVHWSSPTLVNATVSVQPWDVAYWCHGADNGSNANISFDFSYGGQSTSGLAEGTLGVNLSTMLAEVEALLPAASCWTGPTAGFSQFYLGEEDLGSEDGALGGTSYNYNWTVDAYCLHTHVRAPGAPAVGCPTTLPADAPGEGPRNDSSATT